MVNPVGLVELDAYLTSKACIGNRTLRTCAILMNLDRGNVWPIELVQGFVLLVLLLHLSFDRHDHVVLSPGNVMRTVLRTRMRAEFLHKLMVLNAEFHIVPLHAGLDSPGRSAHDAL